MKLTEKDVRGITVVEVKGKLIGGPENADHFHDFFRKLLAEDKKLVAVDLGKTAWANSQGIGFLIGAYTSVTKAGGDLVLARVVNKIHDILSVTKLLLIFKSFEKVDEAVDYLVENKKSG